MTPEQQFVAWQFMSGICWSVVYIDIVNRGFRDKTCGMPLFALAFNASWEFILAFGFRGYSPLGSAVATLWFLLDVLIIYIYFKFGPRPLPQYSRGWSVLWSAAAFVACFLTIHFAIRELGMVFGPLISAFSSNLMMAILFVSMIAQRGNVGGQSMYIGIFKWLGTLAATLQAANFGSRLIIFWGIAIFVYDLAYVWMLYAKFRQLGLNPWTRRPLKQPA